MRVLAQYQNTRFHALQVCEKYLDDPYNTWIFPGILFKVVAAESVIFINTYLNTRHCSLTARDKKTHFHLSP